VPAKPITLSWTNFRHAAEQAGLSRQYGGVHFEHGDKDARAARHPLPGTCGGRRRSASLRSPGTNGLDAWVGVRPSTQRHPPGEGAAAPLTSDETARVPGGVDPYG
jgi:hypothetical protein